MAEARKWDPTPFSHRNFWTPAGMAEIEAGLAAAGVRPLPYPFASALAIASDVDSSSRARFAGYVGSLVDHLGLDFGDSTWVQPKYVEQPEREPFGVGFGFFDDLWGDGSAYPPGFFATTRTLNESVAAYHRGDVDHWHAFLPRGPRVLVARSLVTDGNDVIADLSGAERKGAWAAEGLVAGAVIVQFGGDAPGAVQVETTSGDIVSCQSGTVLGDLPDSLHQIAFDLTGSGSPPRMEALVSVRVSGGASAGVRRVLVANVTGPLLTERLRTLRDTYGVEMGAITTHSSYHFRQPRISQARDTAQAQNTGGEALSALTGSATEADGLVFSTEADDPWSLVRVMPDAVDAQALRFVVPAGFTANSPTGSPAHDLVRPAGTRSDAGIYVAKRVMPNAAEPPPGKVLDQLKSCHGTFETRVDRFLDDALASPGLLSPLYTHLGSFDQGDDPDHYKASRTAAWAPEPYFAGSALRRLQDHVFNRSGQIEPGARVWFTRASVLYDYALMMRSLGSQISRPAPDTIDIASWHDDRLGLSLPLSPAQLYGVTLYVEDAARANVRLDGQSLLLARNPADDTGRPSVTILESEIVTPVFGQLDPASTGAEASGGAWTWGDRAGVLSPGAGTAALRIPVAHLDPAGAQSFALDVRSDGVWAVQIETETGGRFVFGDPTLVDAPTATYATSTQGEVAIPFGDLVWSRAPGDAMPNHRPVAVTLIARDGPATFRRPRWLRPRATSEASSANGFCVGGNLATFIPSVTRLVLYCEDGTKPRETCVDQRGWFLFPNTPVGIYRLAIDDAVPGEAFEIGGHRVDLRLA